MNDVHPRSLLLNYIDCRHCGRASEDCEPRRKLSPVAAAVSASFGKLRFKTEYEQCHFSKPTS
jgi:hypothetical protein